MVSTDDEVAAVGIERQSKEKGRTGKDREGSSESGIKAGPSEPRAASTRRKYDNSFSSDTSSVEDRKRKRDRHKKRKSRNEGKATKKGSRRKEKEKKRDKTFRKSKKRHRTDSSDTSPSDSSDSESSSEERDRRSRRRRKKESEEGETRRSVITGKKIKMHIDKTDDDRAQEEARQKLLDFMNSSYK